MSSPHVLAQLMSVIESRRAERPAGSYTTTLFEGGLSRISEKIREESAEMLEAAAEADEPGRRHLIHEAADLVYHLLVLLAERKIPLTELEAEISRRFGTSGFAEKAARPATK